MKTFRIVKNEARLTHERVITEQLVSNDDGFTYTVAASWIHKRTATSVKSANEWVSMPPERTEIDAPETHSRLLFSDPRLIEFPTGGKTNAK